MTVLKEVKPAQIKDLPPQFDSVKAQSSGCLEKSMDIGFAARLAIKEKQIQQNYRPIIGIHKWFARRPGTVFRSLMLAEFAGDVPKNFFKKQTLRGIIADPFMGGGTPVYEANRLGFGIVASDVNPMSYWIVKRALEKVDLEKFKFLSDKVCKKIDALVGEFYKTTDKEGKIREVKYFIWVKQATCPQCKKENDLFPGYLLAENERHPSNVVACHNCGDLNKIKNLNKLGKCRECDSKLKIAGPAKNNKINCKNCSNEFRYPVEPLDAPPKHRLWAIEYHCGEIKGQGRFFKAPDKNDFSRLKKAVKMLNELRDTLPIPKDKIPDGDETKRLHRWGYQYFHQMFSDRQLLTLGLLGKEIKRIEECPEKDALLTVFSDILRYQNFLCRYDSYALKCQDIFSVHGFPVSLVQCENNIIGIPRVGSGAFRHFVEKYIRAKQYCVEPFETVENGFGKKIIPITGETIEAEFVDSPEYLRTKQACILNESSDKIKLGNVKLDGVFTDPPYFDNVQYAELMDFCYSWLKELSPSFKTNGNSTKSSEELTGNLSQGKGLVHFTAGISRVFSNFARNLKPSAPFVFTYHHNNPSAYLPLVVAVLDSGMDCSATIPVPAEMSASMHIANSKSSIIDSVFVCRNNCSPTSITIEAVLRELKELRAAGVRIKEGDIRCVLTGHFTRLTINSLRSSGWNTALDTEARLKFARACMVSIFEKSGYEKWVASISERLIHD